MAAALTKYLYGRRRGQVLEVVRRFAPWDVGIELVRVGGDADGGYLIPNDLDDVVACFSPGVGNVCSFEADLLSFGVCSFMADGSIEPPVTMPDGATFLKKFVGTANDANTVEINDWMEASLEKADRPAGDLILQMDIEGAEYATLLALSPENLKRFRILVVEFHHLKHLRHRYFRAIVSASLAKVAEHFVPCHLHANNFRAPLNIFGVVIPRALEVTFLRRDRVKNLAPIARLPHPLDEPNIPHRPNVRLPSYWWHGREDIA